MKIGVEKPGLSEKAVLDGGERTYFDFSPEYKSERRRHDGQLVVSNGWINLDYDDNGFLVGLEIVEGDPFAANIQPPTYLQPKNPVEKTE